MARTYRAVDRTLAGVVRVAAGAWRWFCAAVAHIAQAPFRNLPNATIGVQITLLSLVTTVPFLLLIIAWSIQDAGGMAHMIAGLIWATAAAIGLGALAHRRLSVPIAQLSATAQRIGRGDFGVRAPFQRRDELGELAHAMDAMTVNIQSLTSELFDTRERMARAIGEVGRLATSDLEAARLWPLLADIARRLTSSDGSAVYVRGDDGDVRLCTDAGLAAWPARGALADQLLRASPPGDERAPVWHDRRMAAPIVVGHHLVATIEVYRRSEPFSHDTERLLGVFARQAGIAVERADLRRQAADAYAWEQTSRTQSEFIAMASHELRNPVASLRSYVEALRQPDTLLDEQERAYCLERVEHLSGRLGDIVRNLLSASRIRSGQLQVACAPTPLAPLVHGVVNDMRQRNVNIEFRVQGLEDLPAALADPVCLEEILTNLLSNAVRHSPDGAPVTISGDFAAPGRVRLHVRDHGPGLSPAQQARLFQRFVRLETPPGAAKPSSGLGLGLYLCRTYAEQMGGSVSVRSAAGEGAVFNVDLPVAASGESKDHATGR